MAVSKPSQSLFGMNVLKKRVELVPLVGIMGFACVTATAYVGYMIYQKSDVNYRLNRNDTRPPWEKVDPEKPQKLVTLNQKYQKIPELEALRKEIGSYKY